jgi:hypothetical protein
MRLIALLGLVLLAGCAARPAEAWQPERAEAVAWWVEDVAHGLPRQPGEVDMIDAGPRDAAIARWAAGSQHDGRWQPPRQLAARRARWPSVAAALAEELAVPAGGDGLLAPALGVPPVRRAEIDGLIDAENADRRFLDQLVLTLGSPDPAVERIYRAAVRAARARLDAPAR